MPLCVLFFVAQMDAQKVQIGNTSQLNEKDKVGINFIPFCVLLLYMYVLYCVHVYYQEDYMVESACIRQIYLHVHCT